VFLIEVSSSEDLKEPENEAAEISQPSLILDKPISDPFQSLGSQLTISHLGATWSSFHQITSNHFSVHLLIISDHFIFNSDHLERGTQTIWREATLCWPLLPQVDLAPLIPLRGWSGVYMFEELECPWLE